MKDKILLTGGRPTGEMHLGHYFGAFKEYINLQENYNCFFVISDIHMLTTAATSKAISNIWNNAIDMVIDVISMGLDPTNTIFYLQSNIMEMPYYYTLIQNFIDVEIIMKTQSLIGTINEMRRNAQLEEISLGLLAYPVMEAADILSLNADIVTVGKDNIDHVEIAKMIVEKINNESTYTLKSPKWISNSDNNIIGIDGKSKMSKSLNNCIYISDSYEEIKNKVMNMPWLNDILESNVVVQYLKVLIPHVYKNSFSDQEIVNGELYCKKYLIAALEDLLVEMRNKRKYYKSNKDYISNLILEGTQTVREISKTSLNNLKRGLGYNQKYCIW